MLTMVETPTFSKLAADYWSEDERGAFAAWTAGNPDAGDVVCTIRWFRPDSGKRGGVRVLYFNRLGRGEIWLLLIYAKSARETIPAHVLKAIKEEIEDADD